MFSELFLNHPDDDRKNDRNMLVINNLWQNISGKCVLAGFIT
jgi:hypothetical protein